MFNPNPFVITVVFWIIILLIDRKCKLSRYSSQYKDFLQKYGITLTAFHIQFKTLVFNRLFTRIGRSSPYILTIWFNVGALFGIICLLSSIPLLAYFIYKSYWEPNTKQTLQPVMPGVNLPWNQLYYYITTLVITGGFHEVGHAIAATKENVKINSFGFFLWLLYPGAFVELNTVQLEIVSPLKRLRIFTAGVWHNLVLALVSFVFLSFFPYILLPFYTTNQGIAVTWIDNEITISSKLQSGSVVNSVNRCPISSVRNWYTCLQSVNANPIDGYCNTITFVKTFNSSLPNLINNEFKELDCCNDTNTYRFCYHYDKVRVYSRLKNLNENGSHVLSKAVHDHACLPARLTMSSKPHCYLNKDCNINMLCLKPLTGKLTRIIRIGHSSGQDILYVGDPRELSSSIMVSDYVPKHNYISPNLPGQISLIFKYLFSISSALALLNMVPCFYLDGHQVLRMLLLIIFPHSSSLRPKLEVMIVFFCTFLLAYLLLFAFYSLFFEGKKFF